MVAVPGVTPVTMPDPEPTVATVVALLDHVTPGVASLMVVVDPAHTGAVPPRTVIAGNGLVLRILLFPASAIYRLPLTSIATSVGVLISHAVAGEPSPSD